MYNLYEIGFMIVYFGLKVLGISVLLLSIQGVVYKITGFSIYKAIMRMANKIIKEEF